MAGRLPQFLQFWKRLTNDKYILSAVAGYKIEFIDNIMPVQWSVPKPIKFSIQEERIVDETIKNLLEKGVIKLSCHEPGEFINTIFVREKKNKNEFRMILNLKLLNEHVEYHKFKMDTIRSVIKMIQKDNWMATVDIRDAYYTVKIAKNHRKFLKFFWKGRLYQYECLPNGLSSAPRLFTKIMKPIMATLRSMGHTVLGYIDDIIVIGETENLCTQAVKDTLDILHNCGFLTHDATKSVLKPTRLIQFLGFDINSNNMTISPTQQKKADYSLLFQKFYDQQTCTIRQLCQIIGKIVSTLESTQYGALFYRKLEAEKNWALKRNEGNFDAVMQITPEMREDLAWWLKNLNDAEKCLKIREPEVTLWTDATKQAWGASNGTEKFGGLFTETDKLRIADNINAYELLAIKMAIASLLKNLKNKHVLIKSDNTTAVTYVNNMGGLVSPICNTITRSIWLMCKQHNVWLTAEHIPGIENTEADAQSRNQNDRTEWALNQNTFDQLCNMFGVPDIDLFAAGNNKKLSMFVSWTPQPGSYHVDAFTLSWSNLYVYIFPPFSLLLLTAQKLVQDKVEDALAIVPWWPTQVWFPLIMKLLAQNPVLLPNHPRLLTLAHNTKLVHPMHPQMKLLACKLSTNPCKQKEFQRRLPTLSWHHGGKPLLDNTAHILKSGLNFAVNEKLITPTLLSQTL